MLIFLSDCCRCVWSQRLLPVWEKFAQEARAIGIPVGIGKVDCVAEADLCSEAKVFAYPTLRWYHSGVRISPDYKMDRTVAALMGYTKQKLEMNDTFKEWETKNSDAFYANEREMKRKLSQQDRPEYPSCLVMGHLMVNRVPGIFQIKALSKNHNFNAAMTNLSHIVHHLSFGNPSYMLTKPIRRVERILEQVPAEHKQFKPMNGKIYTTKDYHQAFHHFIRVVPTNMNFGSSENEQLQTYQFVERSQIFYYDEQKVPDARFSYDLSPIGVVVEKYGRHPLYTTLL